MALLRAILLLHYKGAVQEGGERRGEQEKETEVDTVGLAGHRDIPTPYSVTGRKGEGCMAMVCASIIMRRTGERQQQ